MTNSTSLLGEGLSGEVPLAERAWESELESASVTFDGVRFRIARMSFARRLALARRIRDLAQRAEFLAAGETAVERLESAVLSNEIDGVYA
ncbi:MAG: hypothetical protein ABI823_07630, partial [Bryobacteraceae bacterium]